MGSDPGFSRALRRWMPCCPVLSVPLKPSTVDELGEPIDRLLNPSGPSA